METTDHDPELRDMSLPEIAEATGLHINTVRTDLGRGYFTARLMGKRHVVPGPEAADYIKHRKQIVDAQNALEGLRATIQQRKDKRDAARRK